MTQFAGLARALLCWFLLGATSAWAMCGPEIISVQAAAEQASSNGRAARPVKGWRDVSLPNRWESDLAKPQDTVWYRIDWQLRCSADAYSAQAEAEPLALGIDGMSLAGEVYSNDTLVWRDHSMVEPFSLSWNMPRWWVLPESSIRDGVNSVWVKVTGVPALQIGLGPLRLGPVDTVQTAYAQRWWSQRTVYMLTLGMNVAIGGFFFIVWLMRRSERSFGWYALTSLSWAAYLATILATSSQPWLEALSLSRLNIAVFAVYVGAFCMFMWRFGAQQFPRIERLLLWSMLGAVAAALFAPRANAPVVFALIWYGFGAAFFLNCLQFEWHVWRPHSTGRSRHNIGFALCLLLILVVAVHDMWLVVHEQSPGQTWNPIVAPLATLLMALLLGGRLAQGMRMIEQFNFALEERVEMVRQELEQALSKAHTHALENAKLQERVQISHDLHDGLGGTLVRGLAMVEQAPAMVPKERVLSMLKIMRDDLRQVIDHGASSNSLAPESPLQWIAPVRHRFTRILDELDVASHWRIAPEWPGHQRPTALQCLGLTRLVEEALANIIKHSRARHVRVSVLVQEDGHAVATMSVCVEDDGIGFDVAAVKEAGLTVGFRSMTARAKRIGAVFDVESGPSGTSVCAIVPMANVQATAAAATQQVSMDASQDATTPAPCRPQRSVAFTETGLEPDVGERVSTL
ncbi:ATP-binding protein [Lampropedia aestuarii]|nr:ATP-binding protein [Lampropedia aestuarii]